MADLERRFIAACTKLGILLTDTCINYQTIMPPVLGEHVAYGDTGVVIYSNSVCGARSNFEGGPSALAAGLTGRTPRYGLHLDEHRRATRRFVVRQQPDGLTDWGVLGAVIGRKAGSYWEIPVIEGIERVPTSDEIKHMGAAMASYGSTPLFHIVGITPECHALADVGGDNLKRKRSRKPTSTRCASRSAPRARRSTSSYSPRRSSRSSRCSRSPICAAARRSTRRYRSHRLHIAQRLCRCATHGASTKPSKSFGGKVLQGTCFYQQYAREIGEANGWKRLLSNSTKIVNILGGYGYAPALASMEECIASAVKGEIV